MIQCETGDIFKIDTEAIVNPVNCVGVMGAGLAAQFKRKFPENFSAYRSVCTLGQLKPGVLFIFELPGNSSPRYIVNFPTKIHWKEKSDLIYIASGLEALLQEVGVRGIKSIAIPPLGCGLGGLDWNSVLGLIERAFGKLQDVQAIVTTGASV